MPEYIEREELRKHILEEIELCGEPDASLRPIAYGTVLGLKGALSYINTLPAEDVVEVKHGEWITPTKIKSMTIPVPHCSLCGNVPCDKSLYCPYCGAKMDLKEGAEE